jgi:two-component system sensor histidine kinase HydH
MDLSITSSMLASVVCLTMAIAVLIRRPKRPLYTYFGFFALSLFAWHGALLLARLHIPFSTRLPTACVLLIPPTALLFFRELLRSNVLKRRRVTRTAWVVSLALTGMLLSPLAHTVAFQAAVACYVSSVLVWIQQIVFLHARTLRTDSDRKRLLYVYYGGLITLFLTAFNLFPQAQVMIALGNVAILFYVYFLYQSIIARRFIDLVEFLGKAAVLASLTFLLAAVYALLVLWVGSNRQGLWLFNTLVASFVILIIYDQVKPWIEETTAKVLFRQHYQLKQVVRKLLRSLRTTISVEDMRDRVLNALHESGRAAHVALYLSSENDSFFVLFGFRGKEPAPTLSLSRHPALVQELRRVRRPILLEHLTYRHQELPTLLTGGDPTLQRELERTTETIMSMRSLNAHVLLPMLVEEKVVGVLTLGTEHTNHAYSTDELATLLSLAEACAIVIENSYGYEKTRERDRLAAVGEMAAGMAHEIRNPLGAIKGAAQCLEPKTLPKEAQEFIEVIIEEVDRLNGVVSQFLEYTRPSKGNPSPTDVKKVVLATLKLLQHSALPAHVHIHHAFEETLPLVWIDPEQLRQVVLNLLLNAVQAMPEGGDIHIKTQLHTTQAPHKLWVQLTVQDTGTGISPDHMSRIFVPFFTTKNKGTGLGLAVSRKIIEQAGGRLEVVSGFGQGAVFSVLLPV